MRENISALIDGEMDMPKLRETVKAETLNQSRLHSGQTKPCPTCGFYPVQMGVETESGMLIRFECPRRHCDQEPADYKTEVSEAIAAWNALKMTPWQNP
jgi:hypothetical protein